MKWFPFQQEPLELIATLVLLPGFCGNQRSAMKCHKDKANASPRENSALEGKSQAVHLALFSGSKSAWRLIEMSRLVCGKDFNTLLIL